MRCRVVKLSLTRVAASTDARDFLRGVVEQAHNVRWQTHLLIRAYLLGSDGALPDDISLRDFFKEAARALDCLSPETSTCSPPPHMDKLSAVYKALINHPQLPSVVLKGLSSNWLTYEACKYETQTTTHIKKNFVKCLYRFTKLVLGMQQHEADAQTRRRAWRVTMAVWKKEAFDASDGISADAETCLRLCIPDGLGGEPGAMLESQPLRFLENMLGMARALEADGRKFPCVLPLANSLIPGTAYLETADAITLLRTEGGKPLLCGQNLADLIKEAIPKRPVVPGESNAGKGGLHRMPSDVYDMHQRRALQGKQAVWGCFLKVHGIRLLSGGDESHLNTKWRFDHKIATDGYSVTLYLQQHDEQLKHAKVRNDEKNAKKRKATDDKMKEKKKKLKRQQDQRYNRASKRQRTGGDGGFPSGDGNDGDVNGKYQRALQTLGDRRIIAIDPGKHNIIYAYDGTARYHDETRTLFDRGRTFRYTKAQRQREMQLPKRRGQMERRVKSHCAFGLTIEQWNSTYLSAHSKKTLDVEKFGKYVSTAIRHRATVGDFYRRKVHRALRFEAYTLTQRSEAKMVIDFKRRMDISDDDVRERRVVIAFGNGSRGNLRNQDSTPSARCVCLFERSGFQVLPIHEAYTSKRCFACKQNDAENEFNWFTRPQGQKVWGLCRCVSCNRLWARDYHATLNIHLLATLSLVQAERPAYLRERSDNDNGVS